MKSKIEEIIRKMYTDCRSDVTTDHPLGVNCLDESIEALYTLIKLEVDDMLDLIEDVLGELEPIDSNNSFLCGRNQLRRDVASKLKSKYGLEIDLYKKKENSEK